MHPNRDKLLGFVLGTLADDSADSLADHLQECYECEATVAELESSSDTVIERLRGQVQPDEYEQESGCRKMLAAVEAIGREPTFVSADGVASAQPDDPNLGTIREYKLLSKLGEGGMGAVYKALHPKLGKIVALKLLPPERTKDEVAVARFGQEMRAIGKLEHPNIVRAMDAGDVDGTHFLVMEYVQGADSHDVDIRADIYGLGATLYKLLCGEAPFGGPKYNNAVKKMIALGSEEPQAITERRGDLPASLGDVVHRMLAKDPDARYSVPAEVIDALAPFAEGADLRQLLVPARPQETTQAAGADCSTTSLRQKSAAVDTTASRAPGEEPRKDAAPRPRAARAWFWSPSAIAVAVGFVAVLALAAVLTFRTPKGTVTIEIPDKYKDEITIVVRGGGDNIEISSKTGWQIDFDDGDYDVALKNSNDRFTLNRNQVKVTRGQDEVIRVTLNMDATAAPQAIAATAELPEWALPVEFTPGQPLSSSTPVQRPPTIPGLQSWTIETVQPRTSTTSDLAYSPDGRLLAGVGRDRVIRVWNTETGKIERILVGHSRAVNAFDWSPDGQLIVSVSTDGDDIMKIWHVKTGKTIATTAMRFGAWTVAWSPNGKTIAAGGSGGTLGLYDVVNAEFVPMFQEKVANYDIYALAWSADGSMFASGGRSKEVTIWETTTGDNKRTLQFDGDWVVSLAFSPDGKSIAAKQRQSGAATVWDVQSSQSTHTEFEGGGDVVAWSEDGKALYVGGTRWQLNDHSKNEYRRVPVGTFAWSPDRNRYAFGGNSSHMEQCSNIYSPSNASKILFSQQGHHLEKPAWSPDGTMLIAGSPHGPAYVWDVVASERNQHVGYSTQTVTWSPDSGEFALGLYKRLEIWQAKPTKLLHADGDVDKVFSLAWSPDGKQLAVGREDGKINFWDRATQSVTKTIDAHDDKVEYLAWSADGSVLFSSAKGAIKSWIAVTGEHNADVPMALNPQAWFTFACDGAANRLLIARGGFRVWDTETEEVDYYQPPTHVPGMDQKDHYKAHPRPETVAFGPGNRELVSCTNDGGVVWCDVATRKYTCIPSGHVAAPQSLDFSPDGTRLATGGDETVWIWDWPNKRAHAVLRHLPDEHWLIISAEGHYRGSPGVEEQLRYVALTDKGHQLTLTPTEFQQQFDWTNDPSKVQLLGDPNTTPEIDSERITVKPDEPSPAAE